MLFRSATGRNIFSLAVTGVVATIATAGVLFSISYGEIQRLNVEEIRLVAQANALNIQKDMEKGKQLVYGLETALSTMKDTGLADRTSADNLLKNLLADNPFALGVWTGWEPDAFDGKDKEFVGAAAHDASGRYMPYWVRSGKGIINEVLVDYTVPGAGDYYIQPFQSQKMVVIEPYLYPIDGKEQLISTIVMPVMIDGKPQGVAGIDISLAELGTTLSALKPMGNGSVGLVTGAGRIVSHPDTALNGKTLQEGGDVVAGWSDLIASPGTTKEIIGADGTAQVALAVPVELTPDNKWFAVVTVPSTTVFASLTGMALSSATVVVLAALAMALAGWLIARRFVRRIGHVIEATGQIAGGRLDVTLQDKDRNDEIGDLSRSLGILLESNREKIRLEKEAEAALHQQEIERVQRSQVHAAREEEIKFVVSELGSGLARLSEGDMTIRLSKPFAASLETIRSNFNDSVEKLQQALLSFADNASTIENGAEEIRAAADNLARRTEQQAASVEETAAALEQITASVRDSTKQAEEAGDLVSRTKAGAETSGQVVHDAVNAMSAIEQSAQSISNIIGVIDEIAFQTNLLALNAGVEAARAGEAGKGFAVVAQEVRELAQRSAKAAKEIKGLITSSGEQVKHGVHLVGQTGEALRTIVGEVQQINSNVQAIVQAAREQSTGLQEINAAVNQMDQSTQQNAAMVEQSNAASHTLVTEVSTLSARLSTFNLGKPNRASMAGKTTHRPTPAPASHHAPAPAARSKGPVAAEAHARPVPSAARALGGKLAAAFGTAPNTSGANADWEEF